MLEQPENNPTTKVQALLTLHVLGGADKTLLRKLSTASHESLRSWSIRILTDDWPLDDAMGVSPATVSNRKRVSNRPEN